jgi:hypothetical protein
MDLGDFKQIIGSDFGNSIIETLKNNEEIRQNDTVKTVMSWYDKEKENLNSISQNEYVQLNEIPGIINTAMVARNNRDEFFSKIINIMVSKLLEIITIQFAELTIDSIVVQTQGKEKGIQFNFESKLKPIKPYVEFIKKMNGLPIIRTKMKFQIDSDVAIENMKILSTGSETKIGLEKFIGKAEVSLVDFKLGPISTNQPKILNTIKFERGPSEIIF